jgi:2-polyprenyl-6-methoxyphenol hydroxylase-like FAD-dependent oxidoreductase
MQDCDVLIVGGGPVGLLLAGLLGAQGVRTMVADKRAEPPEHSMAIGITPPTLEILQRLDLDQEFVRRGVRVQTVKVHEEGDYLGEVSFEAIASDYGFILSLPQSMTIRILQENLRRFAAVDWVPGVEFQSLEQSPEGVRARFQHTASGKEWTASARLLVGCDGHRSAVREALGLEGESHLYKPKFLMADFDHDSGLKGQAHLFFGSRASVESFPLPKGRRRWIILDRGEDGASEEARLVRTVRHLTGHDLSGSQSSFLSSFQPKRSLAKRFFRGRCVLCGDAAHVMSPIGGQGMNTGFAAAELLAEMLPRILLKDASPQHEFARYEKIRRAAFSIAATRAARGMWLGTRTGRLGSWFRRSVIQQVLFRKPLKRKLPGYFAMLTIPRKPIFPVVFGQDAGYKPRDARDRLLQAASAANRIHGN